MTFLTAVLVDITSKLLLIAYVFTKTGKEPRDTSGRVRSASVKLTLFAVQKFVVIPH